MRRPLFIGFSYGLREDGSPGNCNQEIARRIRPELAGTTPFVALQWEIFDALDEALVAESEAVAPPSFDAEQIRDLTEIVRRLRDGSRPAERILWTHLSSADSDPGTFAQSLNALLEDRRLYERFVGFVELNDLRRWSDPPDSRPKLEFLGLEKRRLPDPAEYPRGLRRFQAQRVNRLIIEAILPERVLARGAYLGVDGVIERGLSRVAVSEIGRVVVFGHPCHQAWCRRQTLAALCARGWAGEDVDVVLGGPGPWSAESLWDARSAQVWSRTEENWNAYVGTRD